MLLEIEVAVNWITSLCASTGRVSGHPIEPAALEQFNRNLCFALAVRYLRGYWDDQYPSRHFQQRRVILGPLVNGLHMDESIYFALGRREGMYEVLGLHQLPFTVWVNPLNVLATSHITDRADVIRQWNSLGEGTTGRPLNLRQFLENLSDEHAFVVRNMIEVGHSARDENINDCRAEESENTWREITGDSLQILMIGNILERRQAQMNLANDDQNAEE